VERYQDLLEALDYAAKVLNIDVTDQPAEDATRD
jgi:hypothetical protein